MPVPLIINQLAGKCNDNLPAAGFVTNEGDAWQYTLDTLDDYFEHVQITGAEIEPEIFTIQKLLELVDREPPFSHELLGPYLQSAYVIGHRTAEMHVLLARPGSGPDFEPEAFSTLYQRSLFQPQRALTNQTFLLLRRQVKDLLKTEGTGTADPESAGRDF